MRASLFVTATKRFGSNNWTGDLAFDELHEALARFARLEGDQGYSVIAIFYEHTWNYGLPTHGPRYMIDRRDHSDDPIGNGVAGLINSVPSNYL